MIEIIKTYIIGILSLALAGSGIYIYVLRDTLQNKVEAISAQQEQIGGFKKEVADTGALMQRFEESFKALQADQAKREQDVADAMAKVDELAVAHATYSAEILASTPKSTDLCKESDDMINSYITKGAKK